MRALTSSTLVSRTRCLASSTIFRKRGGCCCAILSASDSILTAVEADWRSPGKRETSLRFWRIRKVRKENPNSLLPQPRLTMLEIDARHGPDPSRISNPFLRLLYDVPDSQRDTHRGIRR